MESFAWPAVSLIGVVILGLIFKAPITRLLDRTHSVGGAKGLQARQQQSTEQVSEESLAETYKRSFDNPLLVEYEKSVRADLLAVTDSSEREAMLVRSHAAISIALAFERAYWPIYGSQIAALRLLNSRGPDGAARADLRPLYDVAIERWPAVANQLV